jgi:hypothetical protein
MSNIMVNPILFYSYYPTVPSSPATDTGSAITSTTPFWNNVTFENVTASEATTSTANSGIIWGLPEAPVTNVLFDACTITGSAAKIFEVYNTQGVTFDCNCLINGKAPSNTAAVTTYNVSEAGADDVAFPTCASGTNTPTNTATNTATRTATNTATNTPTSTATDTPTNTPTNTATRTPTNTSTNTATNTTTNTPTDTSTQTPTNTPTSTFVFTSTSTNTATNTPTNSITNTATSTATHSPTDTSTSTSTNTPTNILTATPTSTPTSTPSSTPTLTPSSMPTNTSTNTATNTPTATTTNTKTSYAHADTHQYSDEHTHQYINAATDGNQYRYANPYADRYTDPVFTRDCDLRALSRIPPTGSPITFNVQTPDPSTVTLEVFTLAFRKIFGETDSGGRFPNAAVGYKGHRRESRWRTGFITFQVQVSGSQSVHGNSESAHLEIRVFGANWALLHANRVSSPARSTIGLF